MITRRTAVKGAAWSVPAVVVASAAPAFAASTAPPPKCEATGIKWPGEGQNTKDYTVHLTCGPQAEVVAVHIDGRKAEWDAKRLGWTSFGHDDSRSTLPVVVTFADNSQWTGSVKFHPAPHDK